MEKANRIGTGEAGSPYGYEASALSCGCDLGWRSFDVGWRSFGRVADMYPKSRACRVVV